MLLRSLCPVLKVAGPSSLLLFAYYIQGYLRYTERAVKSCPSPPPINLISASAEVMNVMSRYSKVGMRYTMRQVKPRCKLRHYQEDAHLLTKLTHLSKL